MIVYENGFYVMILEWMFLLMYKGGIFGKFLILIGLGMYDCLVGVKKFECKKMLFKKEILVKELLVKKEGLKGGGYYVEYCIDDVCLIIEVMKCVVEKGVEIINYIKLEYFIYDKN